MPPASRYIVLSHGRTASTFFIRALDAHPDIVSLGELMHPKPSMRSAAGGVLWQDGADTADFIREHVFPLAEPGQSAGFKLFYFHARTDATERRIWDLIAADTTLPLILLHRKNLFAAYVSETRARASGIWHPVDGAGYDRPQTLTINTYAALSYIARVRSMQEEGLALAQVPGRPWVALDYEDIAKDAAACTARVIGFLGHTPVALPDTFSPGSANAQLTQIQNLSECRSALESIGAGWMIDTYMPTEGTQ